MSHNCCTRVFNFLLTYELQIREHISDMSLEVASYLFMCLRRMEQPLSNPIMQVSFFLTEYEQLAIFQNIGFSSVFWKLFRHFLY